MQNSDVKPLKTPRPQLGLWDSVSIIVGIVVGTAIFRSPVTVFDNAGGPWLAMGLWLIGGVLAWCGALCYAELATTYPRDGGDYEYLNRAFGPWCGFLFSWAQLTTIISGNIAIMSYAFADYALRRWPQLDAYAIWLTIAPVVALSAINMFGLATGKWTQNILTTVKVLGLVGLVIAGLSTGPSEQVLNPSRSGPATANSIGIALVFVLYAYGGWSHAAYIAAEVRDERRNMPRALILGIAIVTLIYLVVNWSYLHALGFDAASQTRTPASDVLEQAVGPWGGGAISVLVMLSALGAINGMVLTGARIYAVWGEDYPSLRWLAGWNRRAAAPLAAIAIQGAISVLLILLVGTDEGQRAFDSLLGLFGLTGLPWDRFNAGFETLVAGSAPAYWILCLLTGLALIVLRYKDPTAERPFTVPLYPLPAVAFCATCAYMFWSSLSFAGWLSLIGFVPLSFGLILWSAVRKRGN